MTEYNKIAEGVFTSTGVARFIQLPFLPNSFELWNITAMGTPTVNEITHAISWRSAAAGTASVEYFNATPVSTSTNLASGGLSFIDAGTYQYGPTIALAATFVTQAAAAVVTTATPHGLATGDSVLLYGTTGMLQIAGQVYTVTVLSTTTFSIPVDSSGFAAAATAGFMKKVLYPDLYTPFGVNITAITTGVTTTITTAQNHGFVVGQEVFFVIPKISTTAWGTVQLDTATYNQANVVPQQAYVTSVPAANQIVVNVNSTGYGAFAFPTSAQAALGITFPQVLAIGDQNSGAINAVTPLPVVPPAITIPGAFYTNTRKGVLIGLGNGTQLLQQNNDVIRWRAIYPDQIQTS
jgi:hypothetical protein